MARAARPLLFCAATGTELAALLPENFADTINGGPGSLWKCGPDFLLVAGVGCAEAALSLGAALARLRNEVRGVVLAGFAGAYRAPRTKSWIEGAALVRVVSETLPECGAAVLGGVLSLEKLGLGRTSWPSGRDPETLPEPFAGLGLETLPAARGATVDSSTGSLKQGAERRARSGGAEIESLEGAVLFAAAERFALPAVEIRAVTNLCAKRDRAAWKVAEATGNLRKLFAARFRPRPRFLGSVFAREGR
ncbi:MAG: hypothetical protein J6Y56_01920 [Fibrobacterales bacterium]|nr:hypothetical protein [Fibrobacterales bacterium]